ncbi:MAG TPA: hypothetical protein VMF07_07805 [Solirubrobacteraceae bacterium]|nr:hypothetical protein [Solirubrobacteraceae bacterium]
MIRSQLTSLAAGAAVALSPLAAAAAAVAAPAAVPAHHVTIVDCTGHRVIAPRTYVLACGDGNTTLTRLRWSHWGETTATAAATEELNLCIPDCVDGRVARFPVTVTAERLRDHRYHEVVVTAGPRRPKGVHHIERWYPIKPGQ